MFLTLSPSTYLTLSIACWSELSISLSMVSVLRIDSFLSPSASSMISSFDVCFLAIFSLLVYGDDFCTISLVSSVSVAYFYSS